MTSASRWIVPAALALGCSSPVNVLPPLVDATLGDAAPDAPPPDASAPEAAVDAPARDASLDAQPDAAPDAPPPDVAPDAPAADVPADVPGAACRGTSDCAARNQVCDVARGVCVECLSGAQCAGMGQACVGGRCVTAAACTSSRTCMGLVCDAARGVCVECVTGADCPAGQACRSGACAAAPRSCRSSRDCSVGEQVCDMARGACVDCAADVDCPSGQFCGADGLCFRQVCTPNATACVDARRVRACDARGATETTRNCGDNETCATGRCQARVCTPGERSCASATTPRTCNADGLGYTPGAACPAGQTCGGAGVCTACDTDGDGDDDGIADADERAAGTDPCLRDSDVDGATDLVERVAGTDPRSASSRPSGLVVELPHRPDGSESVNRELTYLHRAAPLDVVLVVDTTGSMNTMLPSLVAGVNTVATTLAASGADLRLGVADFRDFAEGGDSGSSASYAFQVRQRLTTETSAVTAAVAALRADGGGDTEEGLVPALHGLVEGVGLPGYGGPQARAVTAADCGGDAAAYGWACFRPERRAVLVAWSDAAWHNGPGATTNFYRSVSGAPLYPQLAAAMQRRDARYVGVEISSSGGTSHLTASNTLARDTGSLDAMGAPLTFRGTASSTAPQVSAAVLALSGRGVADVTTRVLADAAERRLPAGRTTAEFVRAVNALRATPDAPAGFERREGGTFFRVAQGTTAYFNAVLRNEFVAPAAGDQVFVATVAVTANGAVVQRQPVYVVVPAAP